MPTTLMRHSIVLLALVSGAACRDNPVSPHAKAAEHYIAIGGGGELIGVLLHATDFVEITAGQYHTCARQRGGDLYCWGDNSRGQIGIGESDPIGQPNPIQCNNGWTLCVIAPTFVMGASQVAAGDLHTCAIIYGDADAYCWGDNESGDVGAGGINVFLPQADAGNLKFSRLSVGGATSCGVSSGNVYCWGKILYPTGSYVTSPTLVWGNGSAVDIAVGFRHACFLAATGSSREVDCWGNDYRGQTGQDPAVWNLVNGQPILAAPFGAAVSRVSAANFTTCVDQVSGYVDCVGIGVGSYQPQRASFLAWSILGFQRALPMQLHGVSTGGSRSCALDANGAAYCWSGSAIVSAVPGGKTFRAIAVGEAHVCAIGTDNLIYCWGDGSHGQLGTGLYSDYSSLPKPTAPLRAHHPA